MNHRYQTIKAIKFPTKDELVPFWKCRWVNEEGGYFASDELDDDSSIVVETIWDCKKEVIIPSFVVPTFKEALLVGAKVAVEDSGKVRLEVIDRVEYNDYEDYFTKYKDEKNSIRLKGMNVPDNTRVIVYRHYNPTYTFESGNPCPHELYVKELIED